MSQGLAQQLTQVFHWPASYPIRLLLPGLLLLSVLLHAAGFYALRSRPADGAPAPRPPAAGVRLLDPVSAEGAWLAARDPAWMQPGRFRDRLLPPAALPARRTLLDEPAFDVGREPPAVKRPQGWTLPLPPLADDPLLASRPRSPGAPAVPLRPTRVAVSGDALDIPAAMDAALAAMEPARLPGLPTELMVMVGPRGTVRHVFAVRSCGDPELDRAAQQVVRQTLFAAAPGAPLRRSTLRIYWGYTPPRS